jgi:hypothetical protein
VKNNSKGFAPVLIIVVVFVAIVGILFYKNFSKGPTSSNYPVPDLGNLFSPTPASMYSSVSTPGTTPKISWDGLPSVMKDIWNQKIIATDGKKLSFSDPYRGWYWWISPDSWNISGNSNEISIFVPIKSDSNPDISLEPDVVKVSRLINDQFLKDGWVLNSKNSSKSISSGEFYDYIQAYTKNDWKCIVVTNKDSSGNTKDGWIIDIRVSCFDSFEKDYQEQKPILSDLNLRSETIGLGKIIDNFMLIGERGRRAGGIRVIKKENEKWVTVVLGAPPPCSAIQTFNIPKGILEENCMN